MHPLPELEHLLGLAYAARDARHPAGVALSSYFQRAATRGRKRSELDEGLIFPPELRERLGPKAAQAVELAMSSESWRAAASARPALPLATRGWLAEAALALSEAEGVALMWALLAAVAELEEVSHRLLGSRLPRATVRQILNGIGRRVLSAEPFAALAVRVLKVAQAVYVAARQAGLGEVDARQIVRDRLWAPHPTGRPLRSGGDERGAYLPSLVQASSGNARRRLRRNADAHRTQEHAHALLARFAAGAGAALWPWRLENGGPLPAADQPLTPELAALCFFVLLTRTASERRSRGGPAGGLTAVFESAGFGAAEWLPDRTDDLAIRLLAAGAPEGGAQGDTLEALALLVRATLAEGTRPQELSRALQRLSVDVTQADAGALLTAARERLPALLRWLEENARELLETS